VNENADDEDPKENAEGEVERVPKEIAGVDDTEPKIFVELENEKAGGTEDESQGGFTVVFSPDVFSLLSPLVLAILLAGSLLALVSFDVGNSFGFGIAQNTFVILGCGSSAPFDRLALTILLFASTLSAARANSPESAFSTSSSGSSSARSCLSAIRFFALPSSLSCS